jgi:hypothetical protein
MSDSTTDESIRAARTTIRRSVGSFRGPVARAITAITISSTTSGPRRLTSFRIVDSSGTRSVNTIRQDRRRCNESPTSRTRDS